MFGDAMFQSLDSLIAFVVILTLASLVVTVIVQMCSAALSLRGKNLANALALTFQTIDPSLKEEAHKLAARILSDPLISDSTRTQKDKKPEAAASDRTGPWHFANPFGAMGLANAVRPEEVYAALKQLSQTQTNDNKVPESLSAAAKKVLDALLTPKEKADAIKGQLEGFLDVADKITDAPVKEQLKAAVQQASATLIVDIDVARRKFEAWFSSAQDRAQQWFQLHTRGLTIAASFLIALVCQLDAVEIFHSVSTNAAQRAALVSSADKVIKEGDGVLDEKGGLIRRIADVWNVDTNRATLTISNLAGVIHTGQLEDIIKKLFEEKGHPVFKSSAELDDAFNKCVATATEAYYKDQRQALEDLSKGAAATGFDLMPAGFWRWSSPNQLDNHWESLKNVVPHLFGIFLFAALLTLGAPYWYNLLKNLSSLRPALAQLIGKEQPARSAEP
jgi:hypothetical protein